MPNDEDLVGQMRVHQECWELLPWVANGRLSSTDAARVSQHLQECTRCTEELHVQHQLCEAIRRDDPVLLAPQASLKKIWQRFDSDAPSHACSQGGSQVGLRVGSRSPLDVVSQGVPAATPPGGVQATASQRLRMALIAQAAIILVLMGWVSWQTYERWQAPRYRTLSSPTELAVRQPAVRIVFIESATVQDVADLLRSVDAQILAGPSPAGVFTLGLPPKLTAESAARTARELRADPRVQFAESTVIAPVQP